MLAWINDLSISKKKNSPGKVFLLINQNLVIFKLLSIKSDCICLFFFKPRNTWDSFKEFD